MKRILIADDHAVVRSGLRAIVETQSNWIVAGEATNGEQAVGLAVETMSDIVIVDFNKIQSFGTVAEVLNLDPFADKWKAFGWHVEEIDGHDVIALERALGAVPAPSGRPTVVIAHTVKGKGVSFMENKLEWHYRSPSDELLAQALAEVGA